MSHSTRRRFLQTTTAAAVSVPYFSWSQRSFANESANDRPQIGCIGTGSMGTGDAMGHAQFGDVVAVCSWQVAERRALANPVVEGLGEDDRAVAPGGDLKHGIVPAIPVAVEQRQRPTHLTGRNITIEVGINV